MHLAVVASVDNRSRIERARAWLEARGVAEEVLVLSATSNSAGELLRELAKSRGAAFGWHRMTMPQLAALVARPILIERGLTSITAIGTEATVARIIHRLRTSGAARRFAPILDAPGLPRAIAGVLIELRLAGVSPTKLGDTTADLAALLADYEAELEELALTDWPGVLAAAAEAMRTHRLAHLPILMLDVPVTSAAEFAFLRALDAQSPEIFATVPSADEATLAWMRELRPSIEHLGGCPDAPSGAALENLQRHLFKESGPVALTGPSESVAIFSAPGEGRECVEIARHILEQAREGVPFDRMAVLLRAPAEYRDHLQEAFSRADIPAHFARGVPRPDPAGRAFLALLACAVENLSARRFAEYLSLAQVPDAVDGAPPPAAPSSDQWVEPDPDTVAHEVELHLENADRGGGQESAAVRQGQLRVPWRWEQLLLDAAVIGSRDRWRRRLDGLANELRTRAVELERETDTKVAALTRTLDDLAALKAYAMPLIDMLAAFPSAAMWGEWLDLFGAIATRALKRPERVLSVLSELRPIAPVGPVPLRDVADVLGPILLQTAVPPPPIRYGKVFVAPVAMARGLSFDTVFVPELAERMFPGKILEEPIILDGMRAQISPCLAINKDRLEQERLSLALAVGAAENQICLSYPRLDLQSQPRPRVPSFYALEALRASEGRLPDFSELAQRAETATGARLGWSAPPHPADAIDNAERDLAILAGLSAAGQADSGAARYLITANPHLARVLRARYQRWGRGWTPADGLLGRSERARAAMARHALGARSYAPTALQLYARCPYRFFLAAIHRLQPRIEPEPIDELDPLQRGSLIHDIQFELLARLRKEGLLPIKAGNLDRVQAELEAVIEETSRRYHDDLVPAIERVWIDGIDAIGADLREWLRRAGSDGSGFVPLHFELSFGLDLRRAGWAADPRSSADAVALDCGIQLRGSIDLIERNRAQLMRVTDHKTGKADAEAGQIIAGGTSLQPLLYALAAEKLFAGQGDISCGRLYFCTSRGGFTAVEVALDDQARAAAVQLADTIGDAVLEPFLPAYPATGECTHCDYRRICGPHEERRIGRKPQGQVDPLLKLRGAP